MGKWSESQYLEYERQRITGRSRRRQNKKNALAGFKVNANKLTNDIMDYCVLMGYHVQRNNTTGIFDGKKAAQLLYSNLSSLKSLKGIFDIIKKCYRKTHETPGASDIIGYHKKNARFLAIEVKVGKDTVKPEQQRYIDSINKAGGIGIIAFDNTDAVIDRLEFESKKYR